MNLLSFTSVLCEQAVSSSTISGLFRLDDSKKIKAMSIVTSDQNDPRFSRCTCYFDLIDLILLMKTI